MSKKTRIAELERKVAELELKVAHISEAWTTTTASVPTPLSVSPGVHVFPYPRTTAALGPNQ